MEHEPEVEVKYPSESKIEKISRARRIARALLLMFRNRQQELIEKRELKKRRRMREILKKKEN